MVAALLTAWHSIVAGLMELLSTGAAEFKQPDTVWAYGQWNFVHFDPNTGRYGILVADHTSVVIPGLEGGQESGKDHFHFEPFGPNGSSLLGSLPLNFSVTHVFLQSPQNPTK